MTAHAMRQRHRRLRRQRSVQLNAMPDAFGRFAEACRQVGIVFTDWQVHLTEQLLAVRVATRLGVLVVPPRHYLGTWQTAVERPAR